MVTTFLDRYYGLFAPNSWKGLARLLLFAFISMIVVRQLINPREIRFPDQLGGLLDYGSMIGMSALLIAIDAMLIVLLSNRTLTSWMNVLGVATYVGLTHVVFPLLTFGATALVYYGVGRGYLHPMIARGTVTAIYFTAFMFVTSHLREVMNDVKKPEAKIFNTHLNVFSWAGLQAVWPQVFTVSIDALLVGPAKIAFMARYPMPMFLASFVYIGTAVFALVFGMGCLVLLLNRWVERSHDRARKVRWIDYRSSQLLVIVFIHFSVFAGMYWLYTFFTHPVMLTAMIIWGITISLGSFYYFLGPKKEIWQAATQRSGLQTVSIVS